jgi:hypothetical protein
VPLGGAQDEWSGGMGRAVAGRRGAAPGAQASLPGRPAETQTVVFMKKVQFAHNRQITVFVSPAESRTFNQSVQKSKHVSVK